MRLGDILKELKDILSVKDSKNFKTSLTKFRKKLLKTSEILKEAEDIVSKTLETENIEEQQKLLKNLYKKLSDTRAEPKLIIKKSKDVGKYVYIYFVYKDKSNEIVGTILKKLYERNQFVVDDLLARNDLDGLKKLEYFVVKE
jgi:hypothetical protein